MTDKEQPLVSIIMGSKSDWETMRHAADLLGELGVPHECRALSAHRTPTQTTQYVSALEDRGVQVLIAGAGGAAHLPGVAAAHTLLPVIGVPIESRSFHGLDSLLSIVQMPAGIPVATMAVGQAGAKNAALMAAAILARSRPELREKLAEFRRAQADRVIREQLP
jgi:5-(carboxyamino)imidazole ribonucleotide mutase